MCRPCYTASCINNNVFYILSPACKSVSQRICPSFVSAKGTSPSQRLCRTCSSVAFLPDCFASLVKDLEGRPRPFSTKHSCALPPCMLPELQRCNPRCCSRSSVVFLSAKACGTSTSAVQYTPLYRCHRTGRRTSYISAQHELPVNLHVRAEGVAVFFKTLVTLFYLAFISTVCVLFTAGLHIPVFWNTRGRSARYLLNGVALEYHG